MVSDTAEFQVVLRGKTQFRMMGMIFLMLFVFHLASGAPVQDAVKRLGRLPRTHGCYHNGTHYGNGEMIQTLEPCLNCTCTDSQLMCYLRVCPIEQPMRKGCIEEKQKGECCPKIWCPEATKGKKDCNDTDHEGHDHHDEERDEPGCYLDGNYYPEGTMLPKDPDNPCEVCYCIRNNTNCVIQECELNIEGCSPVYIPGQCCPCRYNCSYDETTTVPPGFTVSDLSEGCYDDNGIFFAHDGEPVNSSNPCEHCYCMRNKVVCAIHECRVPSTDCIARETKPGHCCPFQYDCPGNESSVSSTFVGVPVVQSPKVNYGVKTSYHKMIGLAGIQTSATLMSQFRPIVKKVTEPSISSSSAKDAPTSSTTEPTIIERKSSPHYGYDSSTDASTGAEAFKTAQKTSTAFSHSEPSKKHSSVKTVSSKTPGKTSTVSAHSHPLAKQPSVETASSSPEKLESNKNKSEPQQFGVKGAFQEVVEFKGTPPPFIRSPVVKPHNTTTIHSASAAQPPVLKSPIVRNKTAPVTAPPLADEDGPSYGVVRISGHNQSFVVPNVPVSHLRPGSSQGIKGGLKRYNTTKTSITRPDTVPVGVKGTQSPGYSIKGTYPTRQRPLLPLGAIPGESNHPVINSTRPTIMSIPGEAICRVGKKVYRNGESVQSFDVCKMNCQCINSVIYCDDVICASPPKGKKDCVAVHVSNKCCPVYHCDSFSIPVSSATKTPASSSFSPPDEKDLPNTSTPASTIAPISLVKEHSFISVSSIPEKSTVPPQNDLVEKAGVTTDVTAKSEIITAGTSSVEDELTPAVTTEIVATSKSSTTEADEISSVSVTEGEVTKSKLTTTEADGITVASYTTTTPVATSYTEDKFAIASESTAGSIKLTTVNIDVTETGVTTDVTTKSEIITSGTSSIKDELTPAVITEIVATSKSSTTEADEISSVSVTEGEVTKSKLTTTEADGITVASYTTTTPVTTSYPEDKFATASESTAGSIKLTTVNINVSETGVTTDATTKSEIITSGTTFIQDESTPAVTTEIVATSKLSTTGADEIGTVNGMEGGVTKSKLKSTEAGDTTVAPHTTTTPVPTSYTEDKFAIASESTTGSIKLTTVNIDVTETGVTTDVPTKSERTSGTSSMEDELAPAVTTEIVATTKTSTTEADEISTVNVMEGGLAKSKLTTTEANDIAVAPHTTTTPVATSYPEDKFSIASESTAGSIKLTTVNINGTKTGATTDVTTKSEIITSGKSSIEDDLTPAVTTEIVATTKSSTTETGEINTVSVMEGGVAKSKLTTTEADDIAVASHTTTTPVATSYTEDKFAIASESTAGSIKLTTVNIDVTETGVTTDVTTKSEIISSGTSSIKDDLTPAVTTEIVATTKSSTTEADEISTVSVMEGGVTKSKLTTTEADGITVASYRTTTPVATSYQEDKLATASVSTAGSVKLTTVNINITETGFTTETPSQSSKWATADANITEDELTNKILTELSTLAITETSITEAGLAIKTETKTPKLTTTGASIANGVFTVETSSETVSEKTEFSTTNIDFADLEFTNETITKEDSTQSKLATSIKVGFSDDDLKVTELSTAEEISSTAPDTKSDYQTFISTLAETNASELELSVETATEPAATKSKETTVGERSTIAEDTAEIVTNTSVSKFELTTTEAKSDVTTLIHKETTTPKNKLPSAADTETTPALISSTETYHTEGTLVNLENVSSTIQVNKDATSEGTISNFSVNTTDFSKFSSGAYTETTFSTYAKTKYTSSSSVEYITTTSPLIPSESITEHPVDSSNQTFPANESTEASKDVSDFDTNISSKFEDADKTQSLQITTFADTSSVGSPSKPVDLVNEITTESPFHLGTHTSSVGFSSKPVDLVNEITTETPFHLGTHTSSPGEITSTETTDNFTPISTTDIVSDASKVYSPVKLDQDSRILTSSSTAQPDTETSTKVSLKHDIEGVESTSHSEEYTISDNKIHMNTENYNLLTNQPTELYNTKFFSTSDESIVSDTEATVKPEMIIDSQTTTSSDFTEISQKVTDLPIATDALSSEQGIRIADELGSSKDNFTENTTSTKETTSSNSEIFETSSQTPSAIFTTTGSNSYSETSEINYTVTTSKDLNEDLFIPTTKKHHGNIHDIILTSTISPQTTASHESTIKTSEDISSISSVGTTVLPKIKSTSKPNYFSDSETGKEILESFDTEIKETKATTLQHAINTDMGSLEAQQNLEPTIQSQTSKYPLLISEELSEFQESLKDSDKTLLGHKISQKKPEISDFNFETVQGQIIGVSNSTSISVIHETDSQTHTSNSSKVTKEIPTTTPGPSIQDNVHHDFTTDFTSETKSDVSTTTEYPSSTDVSSISDFTTHTDTIIQRETLPQVPMQSPENLISPPESENIFDSTEKEFSVNAATKSIVTNAIKPVEASTPSDVFKNSSPTSELSESIKPESPEPTTEKGLELTAEKILPAKTLSEVVTKVSVSSDELNVFLQTVTTETRKSSNEMSTESPKKVSEWSSTTLLDNMTTQPTATKPVEEFTTKLDEKSSETSESTTRQQTDFSTQSTTLIPKLPLSSPPIELTTIQFNISSEKENFGGDSTFPPNVPHSGLEASTLSDERVKLSTETTRADEESSKDFSHAVSEKDLTSSTSGKPTLDTNLTEEEMITSIDEMVDIPQPPAQDNKNLGTSTQYPGTSIFKNITDSVTSDIPSDKTDHSIDHSVTSLSTIATSHKVFSEISTIESTHSSTINETETTETSTSTEPSIANTYEKTTNIPDISTSSSTTFSQSESDLKSVTTASSIDSNFSEETKLDDTQKYLTHSQEDGMTVTTNPPTKDEHIYETSAPQNDSSILKLGTDSVKSDISSEIMEQSTHYSLTSQSTTEAPLKVFSEISNAESTHPSTIKATEKTETTTSTEPYIANTYEKTTHVPDISISSSTTFSQSESDLKTVTTASSTDSSSSEETRKDNTQKYLTLSQEEGIAATTKPPTTDKQIFETSTPQTDSSNLKHGTDSVKSDIYSEKSEESTDYSATSHTTTEATLKVFSEISTTERTHTSTIKAIETAETTASTEPSIANTYEKTTYIPDISTSSSTFSQSESDLKSVTTASSTDSSFSEETRKDNTQKYLTLSQEEGIAATTNLPTNNNHIFETSTPQTDSSISKLGTDSVQSDIYSEKNEQSTDYSATSHSTTEAPLTVFSEISNAESTHSSKIEATERTTSIQPSIANTYEKTTYVPDISTSSSTTFSQSESDLKTVTTASSTDSSFSEETRKDNTQKYLTLSQEEGIAATTNPPTTDKHIFETSTPETDSSILKLGTDAVKSDIYSEESEQSTDYSATSHSTTEAPLKIFSEISTAESTQSFTTKATETTETATSTEPSIANTYEKTTNIPDISTSSSTTFSQRESDLKSVTTASSTDSNFSEETKKDDTQKYLTLSQEDGMTVTTNPPRKDEHIYETSAPQTDISILKLSTDSVKSDISSEIMEQSSDYSVTLHSTTEAPLKVFSDFSAIESTHSSTIKATETTETTTSTESSIANTYEETTDVPDISTSSSTTFSKSESDLKTVCTVSSTDSSSSEETRKDNTQKYLTLSEEEGIAATTNPPTTDKHIFETSTPETDSSILKLGTDAVKSDIYSEESEQSTDYSATSHSTTEAPLKIFSEISTAESTQSFTSKATETTETTTSTEPSIANTYEKTTYVPDISTSSSIPSFSISESDLKTVTTRSSTGSSFSEETRKDETEKYVTLLQEEEIAATTNPPTKEKHIFETSTPQTDSSILKLGTDSVKSDIYSEKTEQSTDYSATSHSTTEAPIKLFSEISTAESAQSSTIKATETTETTTGTEPSIANTYEKTTYVPYISTSSSITTLSHSESDLKTVTSASSTDSSFSEETQKDDTQKHLTLSQEEGMTATTIPPTKDKHFFETSTQTDSPILKLGTDSVKSDIYSEKTEKSTDYSDISRSTTETLLKLFSEISAAETTHSSTVNVTETIEKTTTTESSTSYTNEKTTYVPDSSASSSIESVFQGESDLKTINTTPSADSSFSEETQKDVTQKFLPHSQEGMTAPTNTPPKDNHIFETSTVQTGSSILKLGTDSVKSDISEKTEQFTDYSIASHSTTDAPLKVFSEISTVETKHSSTIRATETTETTTSRKPSITYNYEKTTYIPDISTSSSITTFSQSKSDLKTATTTQSTDSSFSEEIQKDDISKYLTLSQEEGMTDTSNPPTKDNQIFETSTPQTDSSILKLATDTVKSDISSGKTEQSTDYSVTSSSTTESPLKVFSEISNAESTHPSTIKATETKETTTRTEPSIANTYEKTTHVPDISTPSRISLFSESAQELKTVSTTPSADSSFSEETQKFVTQKYLTFSQEEGITDTTNPPTKDYPIFETSTPQANSSIVKLGTDSVTSDISSEETEQSSGYSATSHSTTEAPVKVISEISSVESTHLFTIKATETTEKTTSPEPSIAYNYEKTTYVPGISSSSSITTFSQSESDLKTFTNTPSAHSSFSEEKQEDETQKYFTLSQEEGMTATTNPPTKDNHIFETSTPQTDSSIVKLATDSVKSDITSEKTGQSTDYSVTSSSITEAPFKAFSEISTVESTHSSRIKVTETTEKYTSTEPSNSHTYEKTEYVPDITTSSSITKISQSESDLKAVTDTPSTDSIFSEETQKDNTQKYLTLSQEDGMTATTNPSTKDKHIFETSSPQTDSSIFKLVTDSVKSDISSEKTEQSSDYSVTSHSTTETSHKLFSEISDVESTHSSTFRATDATEKSTGTEPSIANTYEKTTHVPDISISSKTTSFSQTESDLKTVTITSSTGSSFSEGTQNDDSQKSLTLTPEEGITDLKVEDTTELSMFVTSNVQGETTASASEKPFTAEDISYEETTTPNFSDKEFEVISASTPHPIQSEVQKIFVENDDSETTKTFTVQYTIDHDFYSTDKSVDYTTEILVQEPVSLGDLTTDTQNPLSDSDVSEEPGSTVYSETQSTIGKSSGSFVTDSQLTTTEKQIYSTSSIASHLSSDIEQESTMRTSSVNEHDNKVSETESFTTSNSDQTVKTSTLKTFTESGSISTTDTDSTSNPTSVYDFIFSSTKKALEPAKIPSAEEVTIGDKLVTVTPPIFTGTVTTSTLASETLLTEISQKIHGTNKPYATESETVPLLLETTDKNLLVKSTELETITERLLSTSTPAFSNFDSEDDRTRTYTKIDLSSETDMVRTTRVSEETSPESVANITATVFSDPSSSSNGTTEFYSETSSEHYTTQSAITYSNEPQSTHDFETSTIKESQELLKPNDLQATNNNHTINLTTIITTHKPEDIVKTELSVDDEKHTNNLQLGDTTFKYITTTATYLSSENQTDSFRSTQKEDTTTKDIYEFEEVKGDLGTTIKSVDDIHSADSGKTTFTESIENKKGSNDVFDVPESVLIDKQTTKETAASTDDYSSSKPGDQIPDTTVFVKDISETSEKSSELLSTRTTESFSESLDKEITTTPMTTETQTAKYKLSTIMSWIADHSPLSIFTNTEELSSTISPENLKSNDTSLASNMDHDEFSTAHDLYAKETITKTSTELPQDIESSKSPQDDSQSVTTKGDYSSVVHILSQEQGISTFPKEEIAPDSTVYRANDTHHVNLTTAVSPEMLIYNFTAKEEYDLQNVNLTSVTTTSIFDESRPATTSSSEDVETKNLTDNSSTSESTFTDFPVATDSPGIILYPKYNNTDSKVPDYFEIAQKPIEYPETANSANKKYPQQSSPSGWTSRPIPQDILKEFGGGFPTSPEYEVYPSAGGAHIIQQAEGYPGEVCFYNGEVYQSAEQIPRKDSCEFCFCFRGEIICLQQTCPPPIKGCYAIPIDNFCCPRFHCPVQQLSFNNTSQYRTTTAVPLGKHSQKTVPRTGCKIDGQTYRLHDIVHPATNPCMLCRCDYGGIMKCEPRDCHPGVPFMKEIADQYFKRK